MMRMLREWCLVGEGGRGAHGGNLSEECVFARIGLGRHCILHSVLAVLVLRHTM